MEATADGDIEDLQLQSFQLRCAQMRLLLLS